MFGNTRIGAVFFGLDNPLLTDQARDVLAATGREVFELSRVNLDIVEHLDHHRNPASNAGSAASAGNSLRWVNVTGTTKSALNYGTLAGG